MRYQCLHRNKKGYIYVGMPFDARCFLISLSVPYQLNPGVSCPIRGRCTLAEIIGKNSWNFTHIYMGERGVLWGDGVCQEVSLWTRVKGMVFKCHFQQYFT